MKKLGLKLIGKNEPKRLGTVGHPTITPFDHHLLVIGLKYKRIRLNRNKSLSHTK